ncbi:MAG: hypothetical protein H6677_16370 [Candidatus Obscuribacterales bacterium]|nr:hypothetical protein [Candidatus Obscuribacterales bacterium]
MEVVVSRPVFSNPYSLNVQKTTTVEGLGDNNLKLPKAPSEQDIDDNNPEPPAPSSGSSSNSKIPKPFKNIIDPSDPNRDSWVNLSERVYDDSDVDFFGKVPDIPTAENDLRQEIRSYFGRDGMLGLLLKGKIRWQQYRRRWIPFPQNKNYVVDKYRFLGEPVVAKLSSLSKNSKLDYYLVVFHFNIPVTKGLILGPFKYNYLRVGAKFFTSDKNDFSKLGDSNVPGELKIFPARTISIYPENQTIPVDRTDTHYFEAIVKPTYMGAEAGQGKYSYTNTQKQIINLPRVMGIASRYGDVYWTYYPAKWQPVIQGKQTTLSVIAVPKDSKFLHMMCHMEYNIKYLKFIPLPMFPFLDCYDVVSVDLDKSALSVSDLLAIHVSDLDSDVKSIIKESFVDKPAGSLFELKQGPKSQNDYIEYNKKIFKIDGKKVLPMRPYN